MKKPLLACAALLLAATPSLAQINLAWRNCITNTTGSDAALLNINYACDGSAPPPFKGVVSFIAPPGIVDFTSIEIVMNIDVQSSNINVPQFWWMSTGLCRGGSFAFPVDLTGIGTGATGACQNPFAGANTSGVSHYSTSTSTKARARATFTHSRDTPRSLTAGQQYLAGAFSIDTFRDVDVNGSGVCEGCAAPGCLSIVQLEIHQLSSPQTITMKIPDIRKFIIWQGGLASDCAAATPARNHTWGAIKSIYR